MSRTEPPIERSVDDVPAWRLTTTLAVAGALAGLAIVVVYQWAEPKIQAHRAEVLREAIREVLAEPAGYDTLYVTDAGLSETLPAGARAEDVDQVYVGYDDSGRRTGFAIPGAEPGFQDLIHLIFGYDATEDRVLGMRVLENKETPGLGDKIVKDSTFVAGFDGVDAPLSGVKPGAGSDAADEVDMITGATISSATVIDIINHRIEALDPLLEAWTPEGER